MNIRFDLENATWKGPIRRLHDSQGPSPLHDRYKALVCHKGLPGLIGRLWDVRHRYETFRPMVEQVRWLAKLSVLVFWLCAGLSEDVTFMVWKSRSKFNETSCLECVWSAASWLAHGPQICKTNSKSILSWFRVRGGCSKGAGVWGLRLLLWLAKSHRSLGSWDSGFKFRIRIPRHYPLAC